MKTTLICCEMLRDEMSLAYEQTGCNYPIVWIESRLHMHPEKMAERLQQEVDALVDTQRVLFGMGFCGNALAGVRSGERELIVPRIDDCVSMLLGSHERRKGIHRTYFFTQGWLRGKMNIIEEYEQTIQKHGEKRGKKVYEMMMGSYDAVGLLDTGAYDMGKASEQTKPFAQEMGIEHTILPASVSYLRQLLFGPWEQNKFMVVPPNTQINYEDLMLG